MQPPVPVKEKEKEKFLLIPLFALKGMIDDPLGLAKAVQIGIYITARKLSTQPQYSKQYYCFQKFAKYCIDAALSKEKAFIYSSDFFEEITKKTKDIIIEKKTFSNLP